MDILSHSLDDPKMSNQQIYQCHEQKNSWVGFYASPDDSTRPFLQFPLL
jgi:hypothetical protein